MRTFARSTRGGISCSQSLWRSSQQTAETISSHSPGSSETKCLQSKAEIIHTEYQIITFPLLLRVHVNKADGIFNFIFLLQVHVSCYSNDRQCPPVCVWTKTRGQNRGRVGTAVFFSV